MNEYQKVLFSQLQVAGLGIVVIVMGLLRYDELKIFIPIGAGIFLFGLIRFLILRKAVKKQASSTGELLQEQERLYTGSPVSTADPCEETGELPLFDSEENRRERKREEEMSVSSSDKQDI